MSADDYQPEPAETQRAVDQAGGPVWDRAGFESLQRLVRASVERTVLDVLTTTAAVLATAKSCLLLQLSTMGEAHPRLVAVQPGPSSDPTQSCCRPKTSAA